MTRLPHLFPLALLAVATLAGSGPPPETAAEPPIRLIVRGDDMGSSQASNEAAVRCFRDGVMRDVELMAVGPWFPQAALSSRGTFVLPVPRDPPRLRIPRRTALTGSSG